MPKPIINKTFDDWGGALKYANQLFNKGQISRAEIDKIARAAYAQHKRPAAKKPKRMPVFGSLVPHSSEHYMSTPTPTGDDEGQA